MRIRVNADRPDPRKLAPAVDELRRGRVIIYPTDTGYAFGCALSSRRGIAALRRLKGIHERHEKPLTMLVADLGDLGRYGYMSNRAFRVVRRLLPGPYTMVLNASEHVPRTMKNRAHEVGVRFPDYEVCRLLVEGLEEPLLTGSVTPAEDDADLEDPDVYLDRYQREVDAVVDTGPLWPEPSTVLRFTTDDQIEVLRMGQGPLPD